MISFGEWMVISLLLYHKYGFSWNYLLSMGVIFLVASIYSLWSDK